jgi:antitoxin HicB
MKTKHSVTIQWSEDDQVFIASVPEITGLNAFGETPEEAIKELNAAKELFLQVMKEDGESIPDPDLFVQHSGQLRIRIPRSLHASLSHEAKNEGVSLNTYISHLLSERNAFQKVKKELEKNAPVFIVQPQSQVAYTSGQPFILAGHIQEPQQMKSTGEWVNIGIDTKETDYIH